LDCFNEFSLKARSGHQSGTEAVYCFDSLTHEQPLKRIDPKKEQNF
jgi:hypothetical protein